MENLRLKRKQHGLFPMLLFLVYKNQIKLGMKYYKYLLKRFLNCNLNIYINIKKKKKKKKKKKLVLKI